LDVAYNTVCAYKLLLILLIRELYQNYNGSYNHSRSKLWYFQLKKSLFVSVSDNLIWIVNHSKMAAVLTYGN